MELVPNVRVVQGMALEMTWADRVLTEAVEAAATTGNRGLAARALVQRGLLRLFTESDVTPEELLESADRSIAVLAELGDDLGQARAWRLKAQAHYLARRAAASADASERALTHSRRADARFEEQEIIEWLGIALFLGPSPAEAAARRCAALRSEMEGRPIEPMIVICEAALLAMQGKMAEAKELRDLGRTTMSERGVWVWIWIASFWWAFISMWEDNPAAAEEELRPGYEALKKLGSKSHLTSFAHLLGTAAYAQGRYDEAQLLTRECEEAVRPNDVHSHVGWRATRAKVLARRGRAAEAESLARDALAVASTSDFYPAHADALMDLAEVLHLGGDETAATAAVEEAVRYYELKGNALAVRRADAMLAARNDE